MSSPIVGTDTEVDGQLQTKYYCKLDKTKMNMNVVMELKPIAYQSNGRLPLRYVLLIDVSHSMNNLCGRQSLSLLQRVKMFAELAVRKMDENDWLSIVTFASEAVIELPMQRMFPGNKQLARATIQSLSSRGDTNLEAGLMEGLKAIQSAPKPHRPCRDCIILFTDGNANEGERRPENLIATYKNFQNLMNRRSVIPVSALTIGGYHPILLEEIATKLGSESFYWLDDDADFEAEMLTPLFLRETTHISDLKIQVGAKANCYFEPVQYEAKYFTGLTVSKIKVKHKKKTKKVKPPTNLSFFIHSLPDTLSKNLTFNLQVSELQDLDNERVVEIWVQYLDCDLEPRTIHDYILLSTTSLKSTLQQDPRAANVMTSNNAVLVNFSAYILIRNEIQMSWSTAQSVIIKVTEEKCRYVSASSIDKAKKFVEDDPAQSQRQFQYACAELNEIRATSAQILLGSSAGVAQIDAIHDKWTRQLTHAYNTVAKRDARNFPILCSMESSINAESPIGGGVFQGQQPFMNETMQRKLDEEKQNLQAIRRLRSHGDIDINEVKSKAKKAIVAGDIDKMESCYKDLQALKLFSSVDAKYLQYVADEIDHRRELESAKKELSVAIRNQIIGTATISVTKLEQLRSNGDLTFTNDDEEAVSQGHEAIDKMRLKHSMRGEIAKQTSIMKLPTSPKNMAAIASAIQTLIHLRKQSAKFNDVFTSQNRAELEAHIQKYHYAISRIENLKTRMEDLVYDLSVLISPRRSINYEAIKAAVKEMEEIKADAEENYEGLFTVNEEKALQQGFESRDALTAERDKINERMQVLLPILELPMIPRNYSILKEAVEEVTNLRDKGKGFKGVFTEDDEATLTKASANVAILMTKRDELLEKVSTHIPNAALPKLPNNYNKIKSAVDILTIVKQEANGFEGVFTREHDGILQRGHASLQILEAEKEDVEKDEKECVPQLQLPMISNNYNQISKGVATMQRITPDLKGFGLYKDEYDGLLHQATFNRDVLEEKKQQIMKDIQILKVDLKVPLIPDNLPTLNVALSKMKTLQKEADGYGNVFTTENEADLYQASIDLEQLTKNTEKTTKARHRLQEAVEARNFALLTHALKKASHAPFIKDEDLIEERKLAAFLDPENRIAAVENAIEEEDIEMIEEALLDLKEAKVINDALELKAANEIKRLRKEKRRRERQIRREERAAAKRKKALEKLNASLESAVVARDLDSLEKAVNKLDVSEFADEEVEAAPEARKVLRELRIERMRERLKNGIESRDMETLYNALMDAKYGKYEEFMQEEYDEAEALLLHILELMRLRQAIEKMSRATISEVHSYGAPPTVVKSVMKAVFLLLGENAKELTWAKIQSLLGTLGRNSMTKRVRRFRMKNLSQDTAKLAAKYLGDLDLHEVEAVSAMAATLFAWAKYIVREMDHIQEQREKREAANEGKVDEHAYIDDEFERESVGSKDEGDGVSENEFNGEGDGVSENEFNGKSTPDIWAEDDDSQAQTPMFKDPTPTELHFS